MDLSSKFSTKISKLFLKFPDGYLDNKFGIAVYTTCFSNGSLNHWRLPKLIEKIEKYDGVNCIFAKHLNKKQGKFLIYGSYFNESQLVRILNLKAFW